MKRAYRPSAGTVKATDQTGLMKTNSLDRYVAKYSHEQTVWRAKLIYGKTLITARHQSGINNVRTQQESCIGINTDIDAITKPNTVERFLPLIRTHL